MLVALTESEKIKDLQKTFSAGHLKYKYSRIFVLHILFCTLLEVLLKTKEPKWNLPPPYQVCHHDFYHIPHWTFWFPPSPTLVLLLPCHLGHGSLPGIHPSLQHHLCYDQYLKGKNTLQVCSTFSLCDLGKEHIIVQIKLEDATRYPFFCIPFVDIVMENTGQCLSFDLVLYILVFSCFTLYIPVDRFIVIFDIYIG